MVLKNGKRFMVKSVAYLMMVLSITFVSCDSDKSGNDEGLNESLDEDKMFTSVSEKESGIDFKNVLIESADANYYQYMYSYIGGGVAAEDFNNDGLIDLFFTSNSQDNKLYLNKGNFTFEDITEKANIQKNEGFNTGVTTVDINNDGYMDMYIGRGGADESKFSNLLYINNGDLTFTESAAAYGLDDDNRAINSIFFDFDNDNDLDVYISNTPDMTGNSEVLNLDEVAKDPKTIALKGSDKLYRNNGDGTFEDISIEAGILPDRGFGLNPQVGDLNNDGWLDVYVCNDFNMPDFVYLNSGKGTFKESRNEVLKHMSFNSMGSDMADLNNDGYIDLLTLDMNPEDYVRSKTTMAMTSVDEFELMVQSDYHYQYMHNMLQLNNGNGTFSEIGKLAGIGDTDWSWSILSADFNLDGYSDVYVTNGVFRDVIDRDKNNEILEILRSREKTKTSKEDFVNFAQMLPQQKLRNYIFQNNGDYTFEDVSETWVNSKETFSNGATYADLDNDGDLDFIVNNINDPANLLKNNSIERSKGQYLQVSFKGPDQNINGVGAKVNLTLEDGSILTRRLINTRGFLSSVSNLLHFGIKNGSSIASMEVIWPDGKSEMLSDISPNQRMVLDYANAGAKQQEVAATERLFTELPLNYSHIDPWYNDYEKQVLLPHKLSQTGPAIAKADLNNDGLEDVYFGGGYTQAGVLMMATKSGKFKVVEVESFNQDRNHEDVGATFFDADNDGDMDLYVVSGSYEFERKPKLLLDRLYINQGNGKFVKDNDALRMIMAAGSVVIPSDYDNDGDIDLFVGGRVVPAKYPYPATSYLLINDKGKFTIGTPSLAPELAEIGMVTSAQWSDINQDGKMDLIVTGEWMGIAVFLNENNRLIRSEKYDYLNNETGWWNRILLADVDNDGDTDIVAGNLGLNYKFHASNEKPFHVYTRDFDFNGVEDIFLAKDYQGKQVPVRGKSCTAQQLPHLTHKIPTYTEFANSDLPGILGAGIESALHYQAVEFRSGIFINDGQGNFSFDPFENLVQRSPINSIIYDDLDGDGFQDLLLAGNNYMSEVETTRADGGIGAFLKGDGKGGYSYQSNLLSGFFANGDVRNMVNLSLGKTKYIMVANNNSKPNLFKIKK